MGYPTRVQKIKRRKSEQFYINIPSAIAHSVAFQKGEVIEWEIENNAQLVVKRIKNKKMLEPGQRAMQAKDKY